MLRIPDEIWVVGESLVRRKIPILFVPKPLRMAIKKIKLCTIIVEGGMDIILLCNRSQSSVVKLPDCSRWLRDGCYLDLISRPSAVHMFIQTIMEKIVSIATARVRWTNPHGISRFNGCIRPPRHLRVRE